VIFIEFLQEGGDRVFCGVSGGEVENAAIAVAAAGVPMGRVAHFVPIPAAEQGDDVGRSPGHDVVLVGMDDLQVGRGAE
jgi:xanthine/CO dehydrogenase XdhC/CoxF family maturation factor